MNIAIKSDHLAATKALAGRVSVVTGSTSGIGLGIAHALAAAGSLSSLSLPASLPSPLRWPTTPKRPRKAEYPTTPFLNSLAYSSSWLFIVPGIESRSFLPP